MIDPYLLSGIVNALTSFSLGLFVYLKGRKPLHRYWFLMSICVAGWASFFAIERIVANPELCLRLSRIEHGFSVFIAVFYLHSVMHLVSQQLSRRQIIYLRFSYAATVGLFLLIPTALFLKGEDPKDVFGGRLYDTAGPLYFLFPLLYTILVTYASVTLLRARKTATGTRRAQLNLLLFGTALGFLLGGTCFPLVFNVPIPPLGYHLVWLYNIFISYAIFRHQLWDIHVVIRRSLVYSILVTLLTAGYFGLVYGIERIFQTTFGYQSIWVSLSAFALMTLLFQPLKIWIQRLVDWVIFRVPQEELVKRMERLEQEALQAEKFKAISTLAAGMAHEIKNPLTAIKTFAEFIPERQQDTKFLKKLHEVLISEVGRIQGIVQEVLQFAKPKPPQLKPVELGRLISSTVDLLSAELVKHRVRWTVDCRHNGATVQADPDQIRQVLINLIQNAADAMSEGGTLTIATHANNGHVELKVSDTGEGIPKELLPKIFDPFVTTKENGNGLGLAMVHSIIQAHHGTIRAESTLGHGATFTLRLPV